MIDSLKVNSNSKGFILWFLLTLVIFIVIDPFEVAIWRDGAYLLYMAQTVFRGVDLYEGTSFGYTPLTSLLAGYLMRLVNFFTGGTDTILISRVLGVTLYSAIGGSLFCLGREIFKSSRAAHLLSLLFLGIYPFFTAAAINFEPKFLALFFEIWAIFFLIKGGNLKSGILFSLAAMCWQPMVINCLVMIPYFLISDGFNKGAFKKISWFSIGVFIGIVPCLFYLYVTDDWVHFWNQAVIRKANYEGGTVFDDPFRWIRAIFGSRLIADSIFLLVGIIGLSLVSLSFTFKRFSQKIPIANTPALRLLVLISLGWSVFNSLEFQGALDMVPLIPILLIFAINLFINVIENLTVQRFRLFIGLLTVYAFFDFAFHKEKTTFSEQKAFVMELNEAYGDAFVINFEEYYVLQEKPMPTRYMRLARFEDYLIDTFEPGGCSAIISQVKAMKPKFIISRRTVGKRMSSIGVCGQKIIDTFSKEKISTHEIPMGHDFFIFKRERVTNYDVFETEFSR